MSDFLGVLTVRFYDALVWRDMVGHMDKLLAITHVETDSILHFIHLIVLYDDTRVKDVNIDWSGNVYIMIYRILKFTHVENFLGRTRCAYSYVNMPTLVRFYVLTAASMKMSAVQSWSIPTFRPTPRQHDTVPHLHVHPSCNCLLMQVVKGRYFSKC
jgi:hypothetical protein